MALGLCALGAGPGASRAPAQPAPGYRVIVYAHEDLHPDALASLARPGVVLFLQTRSNTLRPSTVARLPRFDEAYVQIRPPLLPEQARALERVPGVGIWLLKEETAKGLGLSGGRRYARELWGPLDDAAAKRAGGAAHVLWRPQVLDLDGFARLLQLGGTRTVALPPAAALPLCERPVPNRALGRVRFRVPSVLEALVLARCGAKVRVRVEPDVGPELLEPLFAAAPDAELELHVGADDRRALRARQLLERLSGGLP